MIEEFKITRNSAIKGTVQQALSVEILSTEAIQHKNLALEV